MSKRKKYMTLFLAYCRKHSIWFSVDTGGYLQDCTYLKDDWDMSFSPSVGYKLGSKACYEYMVREVAIIREDIKNERRT